MDVIQALGDFALDQGISLFQKMYEMRYVVESLCESVHSPTKDRRNSRVQ